MRIDPGIYAVLLIEISDAAARMVAKPAEVHQAMRDLNTWMRLQNDLVLVQPADAESPLIAVGKTVTSTIASTLQLLLCMHKENEPIRLQTLVDIVEIEDLDEEDDLAHILATSVAGLREIVQPGQFLLSQTAAELTTPGEGWGFINVGTRSLNGSTWSQRILHIQHAELPRMQIPLDMRVANLPRFATSFLGRREEIATVCDRFNLSRIVTVVGPPGVGKSRLCVQVAFEVAEHNIDGATYIDFSNVQEAAFVPTLVAQALTVRHESGDLQEALVEHVREREMLLVFDNCEHMRSAIGKLVSTLISECPNLTILAASQRLLEIDGEAYYQLNPMRAPELWELEEDVLPDCIRLFLDRALLANPERDYTDGELEIILQICKLVDCLPLALELAASQTQWNEPQEILRSMRRNLLGKKDKLGSALSWSYGLLDETAKAGFRALSVFEGGFDADAFQAVSATGEDVLHSLVAASLLNSPGGSETTYYALKSIEAFAKKQAIAEGDLYQLQNGHREYFRQWSNLAHGRLTTDNDRAKRQYALYQDNVRAAARATLLDKDAPTAYEILSPYFTYLIEIGGNFEGYTWTQNVKRLDSRLSERDQLRRANAEGLFARLIGQAAKGTKVYESVLPRARALGESLLLGAILSNLATCLIDQEEFAMAAERAKEGVDLLSPDGPTATHYWKCYCNYALALVELERFEEARLMALHADERARSTRSDYSLAVSQFLLGRAAWGQGRYEDARQNFGLSVVSYKKTANLRDLSYGLRYLALIYCKLDLYRIAAFTLGVEDALRKRERLKPPRRDLNLVLTAKNEIRQNLSEHEYEREFRRGALLPLDEALRIIIWDFDQ